MQKPNKIEFINYADQILRKNLLSVAPEEGCALLIGSQKLTRTFKKKVELQIQLIWPCNNIWGSKILNLIDDSNGFFAPAKVHESKNNRFLIDPREQINAQKWARKQKLIVVGSAHSHPTGTAIPSKIDRIRAKSNSLMVIVDKYGNIKSWWMEPKQNPESIKTCF